MQQEKEQEIIGQYWQEFSRRPSTPVASQGQPGDVARAREAADRRARMLKDLDYLTKNPIGAGVYGIQRQRGDTHERSMKIGRGVQNIVDIAGGAGRAGKARYEMNQRVRTR